MRTLARAAAQTASEASVETGGLIVGVATTVEAYVETVLRELIRESGYADHPFTKAMYAELEDSLFQSWNERFRWLKSGFGISIAGTAAAQNLGTLVELRNALVHGGGRLTDRQSRELTDLVTLEQRLAQVLDVDVENRLVRFGPETGQRVVTVSRDYVIALDAEVRTRQPDVSL